MAGQARPRAGPEFSTPLPAPRRPRTAVRIVGFLVVLAFLGACVVTWRVFPDLLGCSSPSQAELESQRAFVQAHLGDAGHFMLGTMDCDDNGVGYVNFTTGLDPASAQAAFLADEACSPYSDDGFDDIAVVCTSHEATVHVFFENAGRKTTQGELYLE